MDWLWVPAALAVVAAVAAAVTVFGGGWKLLRARSIILERGLATSVRQRLMGVLDTVDEAVVFSDRGGTLRLLNRRAVELFDVDPNVYLGAPVVELLRALARKMEEPEDFMEMFQVLREDPQREITTDIDQILPERRRLHLASRPSHEPGDRFGGRIDVYTDVTQQARRAQEVEQLYEDARRVAESYQRALLPSATPALDRLTMVARYLPAGGDRAVCGDFYDFEKIGPDALAVVVGDVCGVGPQAAADAAFCRYTLAAYTSEAHEPGPLFERLNRRVGSGLPEDRFARMLYGVVDGTSGRLAYVNAGHVPPLLRRADSGDVEWLEEGGLPLGVARDSEYKPGVVEIAPGDVVVFYTDGVTEAVRNGRPFGRGRLADLVRDWGSGSPAELVQAITRAVSSWSSGGALRDDVAILVCLFARRPQPGYALRELLVPNEASRIGEVRAFVRSFLQDAAAPVEMTTELVLAVGEAAANCYRHGRRPEGTGEVRVRCQIEQGRAVITVADDGPGFDVSAADHAPRDPFASGGRGLFLMKALTDRADIESTSDGTVVTLARTLGDASWARKRDT